MVAEVRIDRWCDRHRGIGLDTHAAAREVRLDVGKGPREVDLCEECLEEFVRPLADLLTVHSRPAAAPEAKTAKTTKAKPTTTKAPTTAKAVAPHLAAVTPDDLFGTPEPEAFPCVVCDFVSTTSGGIGNHLQRIHGGVGVVYGSACPLCEDGTLAGRHLGAAHPGVGTVAGAFLEADRQGDPFGVIATRRPVWADLRQAWSARAS